MGAYVQARWRYNQGDDLMRSKVDGNVQTNRFENVEDLLSRVKSPCAVPDRYRSSLHATKTFSHTDTLDEAIQLARRGWPGGNEIIKRMTAEIMDRLKGKIPVPEPRFQTHGSHLSISKVIAGNPKPFVRLVDTGIRREAHVPKIANVVINIAASQAIKGDALILRGAAAIVLVNVLERHRMRCSIDLVATITNTLRPDGDKLELRLRVKHDGEHISLDKLAYFLGHPSALRRLMF